MMSVEEAKRIGIRACIDKIGYELCKLYEDTAISSAGEKPGIVTCYVGIDTRPEAKEELKNMRAFILDEVNSYTYYANCSVSLQDGSIEFQECCLPEAV
mgnify:CR=1 FL=1